MCIAQFVLCVVHRPEVFLHRREEVVRVRRQVQQEEPGAPTGERPRAQ